jgi:hypothetical protein
MKSSNVGTMVLAGAGSGLGGYLIGNQANAKRTTPAASAVQSYSVLFPAALGVLGWLLLRKKNPSAAKGLLVGGIAGAGWGYYEFGKAAAPASAAGSVASNTPSNAGTGGTAASPQSNTGTGGTANNMTQGTGRTAAAANTPSNYGTASTATSRMVGAGRRRARRMGGPTVRRPAAPGVRRALNSPFGSGLARHVGDMILPRRFQTGSSAFGRDAWTR